MHEGNPATAVRDSAFLALPLCLHVGKRGVSALLQGQLDAFDEQIMDFASLVEGDLPRRLHSITTPAVVSSDAGGMVDP